MTTAHPRLMGSTTVGRYLATRLVQLGARHLFGLPGDFNLTLLDEMLTVDDISWVGTTNELNAAYTADGYARIGRCLAAVVTTYGVGELSAINGIAGAFAEDVPVIQISGMPPRDSIADGAPLHCTFLDGDFTRFTRMYAELTAAQAILDPSTASREIDRVLTTALTASKPVYLGVPLDVAAATIPCTAVAEPLTDTSSDTEAVRAFARALRDRCCGESGVTLLVGPRVHRRKQERRVYAIADLPGVLVATQIGAKSILDENHPASLGTYFGRATFSDAARRAVDDAALLVLVGTVMSDFTTGFFTNRFKPADAVELAIDHARIGRAVYPGVKLGDGMRVVYDVIAGAAFLPANRLAPPIVP
jgi:TPP-dependent 2-oxoacid decarboxylase